MPEPASESEVVTAFDPADPITNPVLYLNHHMAQVGVSVSGVGTAMSQLGQIMGSGQWELGTPYPHHVLALIAQAITKLQEAGQCVILSAVNAEQGNAAKVVLDQQVAGLDAELAGLLGGLEVGFIDGTDGDRAI